jgi:hypothetical protein
LGRQSSCLKRISHSFKQACESKKGQLISTQTNKDGKNPIAMSFIPTAMGLVNNMDLFVAQLPANHSLTTKPPSSLSSTISIR